MQPVSQGQQAGACTPPCQKVASSSVSPQSLPEQQQAGIKAEAPLGAQAAGAKPGGMRGSKGDAKEPSLDLRLGLGGPAAQRGAGSAAGSAGRSAGGGAETGGVAEALPGRAANTAVAAAVVAAAVAAGNGACAANEEAMGPGSGESAAQADALKAERQTPAAGGRGIGGGVVGGSGGEVRRRVGRGRGLGRRRRSGSDSGGGKSKGSGGCSASLVQQALRPPVAEPVPAVREPVGPKAGAGGMGGRDGSAMAGGGGGGGSSGVVSMPAFKMVFNTSLGGLVGQVLYGMMKVSFTLPLREKVVSISSIQGCDPASFGAASSDLTAVNVLAKTGAMELSLTALKDRLGGTVRVDVTGKEFLLIMAALQWA